LPASNVHLKTLALEFDTVLFEEFCRRPQIVDTEAVVTYLTALIPELLLYLAGPDSDPVRELVYLGVIIVNRFCDDRKVDIEKYYKIFLTFLN